jgi:hypothetical protein
LSGSWRWGVALAVALIAFAVATAVAGLVVLPHLIGDHTDRWAIAGACGVAVAAVAAGWGGWYATRPAANNSDRDLAGPPVSAVGRRSISVGGGLDGIASTGDGAVNVQVREAEE